MKTLNIDCISVRFGGLTAVDQVEFCVKPREIVALIGPNGAGKTTVFNAVTGVYEPAAGCISLGGTPIRRRLSAGAVAGFVAAGFVVAVLFVLVVNIEAVWDAAITRNYVYRQPFDWSLVPGSVAAALRETHWVNTAGAFFAALLIATGGAAAMWFRGRRTPDYVSANGITRTFQNIRLFSEMTALENVLVGMHAKLRTGIVAAAFRLPIYWKEQKKATEAARELLAFAGLAGYEDAVAESLSYGHQRRLEIARALACEPAVLLLDEPAAGMNPNETEELVELLRKIRDRGVAVLLIEHDMKMVMDVSERVVVLDYGQKIAEGTPDEVRANPKVMAAYLGEPEPA